MTVVTLSPKQVEAFKKLTSVKEDGTSYVKRETSGRFIMDPSTGGVKVTDFELSENQTTSKPPAGAVTFHTHNVPPQHVAHRYMSTDVPSWQDFKLVAMDSIFGNLQNHVIFTPNFTYVVGVSPQLRSRLMQFEDRTSAQNRVLALTQHEYNKLVSQHGTNQGKPFLNEWIEKMRDVGFHVQRVRAGEVVSFNMAETIPSNYTSSAAMAYQAMPHGKTFSIWHMVITIILAVLLLSILGVLPQRRAT